MHCRTEPRGGTTRLCRAPRAPRAGRLQNGALWDALPALTAPATSGGLLVRVGKAVGITSNTGPASLAQDTYTPSPISPASGKTFASILQTGPPPHYSFTFKIQRPPPPPSPQSLSASSLSHIPNSLTPIEVPNLHPGLLCSLVKGRKPSQRKWPYGV